MKGSLCHEFDAGFPAGEVWEVYGTTRLPKLITQLLPNLAEKIDVVQGDGGEGTILLATFPSGGPGPKFQKEKFVRIDNEKRVKEVEVIEGGYLDLGFSSYFIRFEITEKDSDSGSSIIRSSVEYEIKDELAANASFATVAPFAAIAEAVVKYLMENKGSSALIP